MLEPLPLFPLNTVLFPGIPLPLHIFEERYRLMMRELLDTEPPRRFGVVAIRQGLEVGDDPVLYDVGCVAELRRVEPYDDGRMDVVTTGGSRFRVHETDHARPYLLGRVEYLPEPPGEGAAHWAGLVAREFAAYWQAVSDMRGEDTELSGVPGEPALLSSLVAAALVVDLPEKQALLAAGDIAARLRLELSILRRELALFEYFVAVPPPEETVGPFSLN